MPKQQEEHQIHTTIESAVDAFVTSTKYQGKTMFWETHNVWIFTNVIPNPHKVALGSLEILQRISRLLRT